MTALITDRRQFDRRCNEDADETLGQNYWTRLGTYRSVAERSGVKTSLEAPSKLSDQNDARISSAHVGRSS